MTKSPKHTIDEMYAFVSQNEGGEGLVGMTMNVNNEKTFMPFVCSDDERMESLKPYAKKLAKESKKKIKLLKFTQREEIEEY